MSSTLNKMTSETLIVNLLRNGDIYSCANLIHSMKSIDPNNKISILVWEEFKTAAKNLKDVHRVYTINRKKILTYKKNEIYSDAFALESFYNSLNQVKEQDWDQIINYSNEKTSAHIVSYLSSPQTQKTGISIDKNLTARPSGPWDIIFNDVLTTYKHTPLHFMDCYHKMLGISRVSTGQKIKINEKYNQIAFKNINELRELKKNDSNSVKIIAIQLTTSMESKNIPYNELLKTIDHLASSHDYYPILLVAPTSSERTLAARINNEFNNELVTVEADFMAIPSLLMNVDLLLTPDTVIKHIADLIDTPVVEVSLGHSPFLKQGTIGEYNLILTNKIDDRDFKSIDDNRITSEDIFSAIKVVLENKNLGEFKFSDGISIYQPSRDSLGVKYRFLAGAHNAQSEISRLMGRIFISTILNQQDNSSDYNEILYFHPSERKIWIENQKVSVSNTVKDVLGTLRALHMAKENRNKSSEFIRSLDKLFSHCKEDTLASIACITFRAKIEALNSNSFTENSKQIESLLFTIKDEIQTAYKCIKTLDGLTSKRKSISADIAL